MSSSTAEYEDYFNAIMNPDMFYDTSGPAPKLNSPQILEQSSVSGFWQRDPSVPLYPAADGFSFPAYNYDSATST